MFNLQLNNLSFSFELYNIKVYVTFINLTSNCDRLPKPKILYENQLQQKSTGLYFFAKLRHY